MDLLSILSSKAFSVSKSCKLLLGNVNRGEIRLRKYKKLNGYVFYADIFCFVELSGIIKPVE